MPQAGRHAVAMDEALDTAAPPPAAARPAAEEVAAKGLGPRALAFIIDGAAVMATEVPSLLVAYPTAAVVMWLALGRPGHTIGFEEGNPWTEAIASAVIMPFFYFLLFEWLYGATPGKVLLNMRVVRDDGRPCGFRAAAVRGLLRYVDGLLVGLGLWLLMRRPPHRRLGDRAAGTLVVDTASPLAGDRPPKRWFLLAAAVYFVLRCLVNGTIFAMALRFE